MTTAATAAQAGDETAQTEPHVSDSIPVQTAQPEPLVVATDDPAPEAAAATEVDAAAEPAAAATEGDGKKPVPKLPDWAQKKIADAAFAEREARRRAKELEDELTALKAPKPAAPAAPTPADAAAANAAAPTGGYKTQAEFDAAVAAEATKRENEARARESQAEFDAACNTAFDKGVTDHGDDFKTAVQNLQQVGAMNRDLLDLVLATEDASKVLFELGSDPDKAAVIMALPPAKRAVEIAKLSVAPDVVKAPAKLSAAPRPVVPVEGSAKVTGEPSDADDDATWFAKRNAQVQQQRGAV